VHRRYFLLAGALALVASCGDSGTGSNNLSGSVSFTYSGAISGSFSASGALPVVTSQETQQWAVGARDDSQGEVIVEALKPRTSTSHDVVILFITRTTVGSSLVDCGQNVCADLFFDFDVNNSSEDVQQSCFLASGTLNIATITSSRVTGTFSGTGSCFALGGGAASFTVSSGAFDVALVSLQDLP
jgi:hypothetical protein